MHRICRPPYWMRERVRSRIKSRPSELAITPSSRHASRHVRHTRAWCMSGSLTRGGGGIVPGIPGACAARNFTYLVKGPSGDLLVTTPPMSLRPTTPPCPCSPSLLSITPLHASPLPSLPFLDLMSFNWFMSIKNCHGQKASNTPRDQNYAMKRHNGVIKWKHFQSYWPFVRGIHRSPVNSRTKASDVELRCFLWYAPEYTVE